MEHRQPAVLTKNVHLTMDDFMTCSKYAYSRICPEKGSGWKGGLINLVIWFVIALIFFSIFSVERFELSAFHWPTAVLTAVPFVLFAVEYFRGMRKVGRRSLPRETGLMLGPRNIEFTEKGFCDTSAYGSSFYHWGTVEEIVSHQGHVYLFVDTMLAQIIPSSSFASDAERNGFVDMVTKMHAQQPGLSAGG